MTKPIEKFNGNCIYYALDELGNKTEEIEVFNDAEVSNAVIVKPEGFAYPRILFDIADTNDFWGGDFKGWLYDDGKFIGKYHQNTKSGEEYKEDWNGTYTQKSGQLILDGIAYDNTKPEAGVKITIRIGKAKPPIKKAVQNKPALELSSVLNSEHLHKLYSLADKLKTDEAGKFDWYNQAIKTGLKPETENDLYLAMCIAYSWMPTMLDLYVEKGTKLQNYIPLVKRFKKYTTVNELKDNERLIVADLIKLSKLVNNSVVGASKVLHIFYPKMIPIFDSNVVKGWGDFFKTEMTLLPELKIPTYFNTMTIEKQCEVYFKYWYYLLLWSNNTKEKGIRRIEESFYWVGKNIKL